jgi:hypothetical protein
MKIESRERERVLALSSFHYTLIKRVLIYVARTPTEHQTAQPVKRQKTIIGAHPARVCICA